jgi:hypothetical protein
VNEAAHLLHFFFLDELQRIEIADFGSDLAGKCGGIKSGNSVDATLTGKQSLPDRIRGIAYGADQANAGNYDPSS